MSFQKLHSNKVDRFIVGSAELRFSYNGDIFKIKSSHFNCYFFKGDEPIENPENYFIKNIFGQEPDTIKINYGGNDKASISSLLRFSFYSDEDFDSKNSNIADIIHTEFDGKAKSVLFKLVMGCKLNDNYTRFQAYERTNEYSKLLIRKNEAIKKLKSSGLEDGVKAIEGLFDPTEKWKAIINNELLLENLIEVKQKLNILIVRATENQLGKNIIKFLNAELAFILENIEDIESSIKDAQNSVIDSKSLSGDIMMTVEMWRKRKKKLDSQIKEMETEIESLFVDTQSIASYIEILQSLKHGKLDFNFDPDSLKVNLYQSSEGVLKVCKFLCNVAFQLYSSKYGNNENKLPLLNLGFYDSVFGGADAEFIIEGLERLKSINEEDRENIQIFIFTNRYNSKSIKNELDIHIEENKNWIYEFEVPDSNQDYLFDENSYLPSNT